jgi:tRNA-intron endonuclease
LAKFTRTSQQGKNLKEKKKSFEGHETREVKPVRGHLVKSAVSISLGENVEDLTSRGYGFSESGNLILTSCEALYLQSKNIVEVSKKGSRRALSFQELLHQFEPSDQNVWVKFLIYRDLRSRGYVVREGFGLRIDFRVYKRGEYGKATARYLVLGIQEGKPITAKELAQVLRHAQSLKKELLLAVVNRRGEIVYYTLSKLTMKMQ